MSVTEEQLRGALKLLAGICIGGGFVVGILAAGLGYFILQHVPR